jgi:hypothetical protein
MYKVRRVRRDVSPCPSVLSALLQSEHLAMALFNASNTVAYYMVPYGRHYPSSLDLFGRLRTVVKGHMIKALTQGIQHGSLRLVEQCGEEHLFGGQTSKHLSADITVKSDDFWLRVFCGHDLGCTYIYRRFFFLRLTDYGTVSEAYMHGDFETTDLKVILNVGS